MDLSLFRKRGPFCGEKTTRDIIVFVASNLHAGWMILVSVLQMIAKSLRVLWASPYTLLGILVGMIGLLTGGKVRFRDGALEFYGGATKFLVRLLPTGVNTVGFTLGHTILGQDEEGLRYAGPHERVHVRQFERWGPLMGPAYLLASAWMWLCGRDAYLDNPFEVEAYAEDAKRKSRSD